MPALSQGELQALDRYWRASNYLSVGQIYLCDNPLLKEPLKLEHVKKRLLGHWGTTPGQNFIYVHLNRVIKRDNVSMIYVSGPGHGGPAMVSQTYLEGIYSEIYPDISMDEKRLFKQFSFPGGIQSHVSPETPGSIHEGGELGYSLSHSFGAVLDKPDLIVACCVGDGEAETGPLATAWHSNKFINPKTDGCVLPILHLNGFKIANPTVLARIPNEELKSLFVGYGYEPFLVEGADPAMMHEAFATALDACLAKIKAIQTEARAGGPVTRPVWPMIVLRSPKGWTGPKKVDGKVVEGSYRSHQVPLSQPTTNPEHLKMLEEWLRSYKPEELFEPDGSPKADLLALAPQGPLRMGANPLTNPVHRHILLPNWKAFAVEGGGRGRVEAEDCRVLGKYLAEVVTLNDEHRNFRIFGPDETASNRLGAVLEVTTRQWLGQVADVDDGLGQDGRVMEMLSEHQCQGWLEGYLLTGRHGLMNSYEAFIHIVDSMFNQHAKWLKMTREIPWRHELPSLNYLLASHVWRQDHNGFTHQDPGFLDVVLNKKAHTIRIYLPPDANCLLSVMHQCLRSRHKVNVVVAGKHAAPQWLTQVEADMHCTQGVSIWEWASTFCDQEPDVVVAAAGDVPTLEALAATKILQHYLPTLKIRFVNVVNLMKIQHQGEHPHGLSDRDFDSIFTLDKPVIFAFHGYPWLIHRLTYRRTNHSNIHVRGYVEEGAISTAFDMVVMNKLDRFHLVIDTINRLPHLNVIGAHIKQAMQEQLIRHRNYITEEGVDMPEVAQWKWED